MEEEKKKEEKKKEDEKREGEKTEDKNSKEEKNNGKIGDYWDYVAKRCFYHPTEKNKDGTARRMDYEEMRMHYGQAGN